MSEPRQQKPRKRTALKFGEKPKRPKSQGTTPYKPAGQIALDFENGDLAPEEQLELFP